MSYIFGLWLVKIFATLGPTFVIPRIVHKENSFWISDIGKTFQSYAQEVAKRLGCSYEYVLYNFLANIFIFAPAIILGLFVLRKKLWALSTTAILLVAYIILRGILSIWFLGSLTGALGVNYVILIVIVSLFTKKTTKALFSEGRREMRPAQVK